MTNLVKWSSASLQGGGTPLATFNNLANGARTDAGTAFDNSATKAQYGQVVLNVDLAASGVFAASPVLNIYMLKAMNGTNYEDGSSSVSPSALTLIAVIPLLAVATAQIVTSLPFLLPPYPVKFIIENMTGRAADSSGNSLNLYTFNDEIQ